MHVASKAALTALVHVALFDLTVLAGPMFGGNPQPLPLPPQREGG